MAPRPNATMWPERSLTNFDGHLDAWIVTALGIELQGTTCLRLWKPSGEEP
jgi:hypothetical protein